MLNAGRLRVLHAVATHGSITGAAAALLQSQPSVSRQVALLERETGRSLVERTPRGVRLTPAGELLARHAEEVLERLAAAETALARLEAREGVLVRVAAFPSAAVALVVPAVGDLAAARPGLAVRFRELAPELAVAGIEQGEIDVGVVFHRSGDDGAVPAGLRRVPLLRDPFLVALPAAHPLAGRPAVDLAELAGDGWIEGTSPASGRLIRRACLAAGFAPRIVAQADHAPIIHGLVAAGVGATLVTRLGAPVAPPGVALLPVAGAPPARDVAAVLRAADAAAPAVAALVERLQARVGTLAER
jgi:DNA-binding transcriptional LysR family regulator